MVVSSCAELVFSFWEDLAEDLSEDLSEDLFEGRSWARGQTQKRRLESQMILVSAWACADPVVYFRLLWVCAERFFSTAVFF